MLDFRWLPPGGRSRLRATRILFIKHGADATPEGRSLRLLRKWLSPRQREQFARKGYFEVIGSDSQKRYRIYVGASVNVCEMDERGHLREGLCFMPIGALPIGDVMLAQKIALETCEAEVLAVARKFTPNGFHFRQSRPLG
ncbi:hypothetical protein [Bradyrhizobium sp. 153]|uniref:hypothetical protein n=1 Tax=Bradyrhizobium sp. 153 TaxID=2782627 RepID=UPI001FF740C0|nr:hypothetical protein [Bradyrhizobium sp. 153]MCK1665555.1 hypothetical protein [Bradyrhizobium sp. 153]